MGFQFELPSIVVPICVFFSRWWLRVIVNQEVLLRRCFFVLACAWQTCVGCIKVAIDATVVLSMHLQRAEMASTPVRLCSVCYYYWYNAHLLSSFDAEFYKPSHCLPEMICSALPLCC